MKQKVLIISLILALLLFLAQPCRAIIISHKSGVIYAETGTNFLGDYIWSSSGWGGSGSVCTDDTIFDNTSAYGYGYASGYKINGPDNNENHARFILHSTAQSAAGNSGIAYETYALVRSGENPGDMLEFELAYESGEEGKGVELTVEAVLTGTLNSGGLTGYDPVLASGTAELDFTFAVYKDPTESPILNFVYPGLAFTGDGIDDDTGEPTLEESISLTGSLGIIVDDCTFKTGDTIYVYFEQLARAIVPGDEQSNAKSYAVQSTDDVITIAIETYSIPEPPLIILLGSLIGVLGFLGVKRDWGWEAFGRLLGR